MNLWREGESELIINIISKARLFILDCVRKREYLGL